MREVCEIGNYKFFIVLIEPKWLLDVAASYFRAHNLIGMLSKKKKAEKLEPL
jgi:ATP-dependent RNA helicase DHX8/PRP22